MYRIYQKLPDRAYKLKELDGWLIRKNMELIQPNVLL